MIGQRSSVESVLEKIIAKVEAESNQKNTGIKLTIKRKLNNSKHDSNKRAKLNLHDSLDEATHCRICYDSSHQLPITYPCKCKVS